ncbi:hypothetical protein HDU96_005074 [Phlyctochytrium bullatum]|nr:hypothetical protein HDU96_005074 [Phlyctochytrium bullatum]
MVGFTFTDIFNETARSFPNVLFSIVDVGIDNTYPQNSQGLTFAEDEAGFLAGALAGALTNENSVGVMGNLPIPPINRFLYGFLSGATYVNPSISVYGAWNLDFTWSNPAIAQQNSRYFLSKNTDVVFAAAGFLGSSTIRLLASNSKWVIGVDADESLSTFANKSDPASNYIFASALKNIDTAVEIALNESVSGQFFAGNKLLDSTVGGVGLTGCSSPLACSQLTRQILYTQASSDKGSDCVSVTKVELGTFLGIVSTRIRSGGLTSVGRGYLQSIKGTSNGTWAELPSFGQNPGGLQGHTQNFLFDNTLLIFGGQSPAGNLSNELYRYSYDSVTWNAVNVTGSKPPGLQNHGAVYRRSTNELFVFGGAFQDNTVSGDVYKFSTNSSVWEKLNPQGGGPGKRSRHAVALIGDSDLYSWGDRQTQAKAYVYNIALDTWREENSLNLPYPLQGSSASSFVQSDFSDACNFQKSGFSVCTPMNDTVVVFYGGSHPTRGIIPNLKV